MPTILDKLDKIQSKIEKAAERSLRSLNDINLLAVTKTASEQQLKEAYGAGQKQFGHNHVQNLEIQKKILPSAEWHLLGPLQGKKVKRGIEAADYYQALGDLKTAERISRALPLGKSQKVLLQLNLNPEDERYGLDYSSMMKLLEKLNNMPSIQAVGLMTLARAEAEEKELHNTFSKVRQCAEELSAQGIMPNRPILSMGMSQDFEIAIMEGSNLVRIGRALFSNKL